jgi:hypothetical protein
MEGNGNNAPSTTLTMTITFDQATGQIGVNGPIQNEMISFYMLEKAKDAVKAFTAQQRQDNRITPATFLPQLVKH